MIKPRKSVLRFAQMMETKLSQHDDRPHWTDEAIEYLFERLQGEVKELKLALKSRNPNHIVLEAADVANMAMMVADVAVNDLEPFDPRVESAP